LPTTFGLLLLLASPAVRAQAPQSGTETPEGPAASVPPTQRGPLTASDLLPSPIAEVPPAEPLRVRSPATGGSASASPPTSPGAATGSSPLDFALDGPSRWISPDGLSGSLQVLLLLTVLSMAPAVLLMTTCYVRIIVVLGLLRQAIGLPSLPPGQVMTSIALFITLFVMTPVWSRVYQEAIVPYTDPDVKMTAEEAWERGTLPVRNFMSLQIAAAGNHEDVAMFFHYADPDASLPDSFEEVPLRVLLPAFMLSELKTAFLMGFKIYLPFLIVDLVVATVTISMGMLMLPPSVISLPFKLLLFVLVDGWRMVVEMLLVSFGTLPVT
jgi:flagellar biosynthetic protein FliP